MLTRGDKVVRELKAILDRECEIQQIYLKLLAEERSALEKLNHERVAEIALKREELNNELKTHQTRRLEIIGPVKKPNKPSLLSWVEQNCHPEDRKVLICSIARLKKLTLELQTKARDFGNIMEFSMRLIKGSLSLIWSGTDHEASVYSGQGKIKTTYIPNQTSPVGGLARKV